MTVHLLLLNSLMKLFNIFDLDLLTINGDKITSKRIKTLSGDAYKVLTRYNEHYIWFDDLIYVRKNLILVNRSMYEEILLEHVIKFKL